MPRSTDEIDALYRTHGHVVYRRALCILNDPDEAKDVVHELFASLIDRPQQFGARSSITTWLYSATVHLCMNKLRNHKTRARLVRDRLPAFEDRRQEPLGEHRASLGVLLKRMPEELAQVAIYHSLDGLTQEEIAEVLTCSRRHVVRLLERLEVWVNQQEHVA